MDSNHHWDSNNCSNVLVSISRLALGHCQCLGFIQPAEPIMNESALVGLQLAQCRFPELAISSAKILIYFFK